MEHDTGNDTDPNIAEALVRFTTKGIPVFPLQHNSKIPVVEEFPEVASVDEKKIAAFFFDSVLELFRPYNIGLLMRGFIGVDIDSKDGRPGDDSVLELELQGKLFPLTLTQYTPTGGTHLVYSLPKDFGSRICNSVQSLAPGIDIRGNGGYLVGASSSVPDGSYRSNWADIVPAPQWLLDQCSRTRTRTPKAAVVSARPEVNTVYALKRGKEFITASPGAGQGSRDSRAYELACHLRNLGVTELDAYDLLDEAWAPRCEPPFASEELLTPVENAYRYAKDSQPILAPEFEFDELVQTPTPPAPTPPAPTPSDPVLELNKDYAFVISGSSHHIIFETTDFKGYPKIAHYSEETFHKKLGSLTKMVGEKPAAVSRLWMKHPLRRYYEGFCFSPGREYDRRYYNIWRGFNCDPCDLDKGSPHAKDGLDLFLEHSLKNVCQGEQALHEWLMGYFAHIFQRPWEKPEIAVVFRGKKGVGKNALLKHLRKLLTPHFIVASHKRFLEGNFNSHLEGLIGIVLDEMFWAGKKDIEGILKDMITGETHLIERKGMEPYEIDSCLRTFILGNEKWIVPVSEDERRYAIFEVGEDRRLDIPFFEKMREGLEAGGYSLLLRYFLDYDLSKIKVRIAPHTKELFEQKIHSFNPFENWWYDNLQEGVLKGSTFLDGWPTRVTRNEFRDAYQQYKKEKRFSGWGETDGEIGRLIRRYLPTLKSTQGVTEGKRIRSYDFPSLAEARENFEQRMNHKIDWEE